MKNIYKLGIVLLSVLFISILSIPSSINAASQPSSGKIVELSDADFWAKAVKVFGPQVKTAKRIYGQYESTNYYNATPGTKLSGRWSGYELVNGGGTTIDAVSGSFTAAHCTGTGAHDSEWVGISESNDNLLQTGVNMKTMKAWWEKLPASEQDILNFNVAAGDNIEASVSLDSGTTWFVALYNVSQDEAWGAYIQNFTPSVNGCEWIVECCPDSHIGTFGTVYFSDCYWYDSSMNIHNMNYGSGTIYTVYCHNPYAETMSPSAIGVDNRSFSVSH